MLTQSNSGMFNFGQTTTASNPPTSGFNFGQNAAQSTGTTSGFSFGSSTPAAATGFGFGQTATTNTTPATGFGFGQTTTNTATTPGFGFGQNSANTATSSFGFGQSSTNTAPAATGFNLNFGQTNQNTTAPANNNFSFGNTTSSTINFGGNNTNNSFSNNLFNMQNLSQTSSAPLNSAPPYAMDCMYKNLPEMVKVEIDTFYKEFKYPLQITFKDWNRISGIENNNNSNNEIQNTYIKQHQGKLHNIVLLHLCIHYSFNTIYRFIYSNSSNKSKLYEITNETRTISKEKQ